MPKHSNFNDNGDDVEPMTEIEAETPVEAVLGVEPVEPMIEAPEEALNETQALALELADPEPTEEELDELAEEADSDFNFSPTAAEVEDFVMGQHVPEPVILQPGFYLVNNWRELYREGGEPWRADRKFEAQRKLGRLQGLRMEAIKARRADPDCEQWAILEVTVANFAWGE